jgi:hypothetical protein
VLDRLVGYSVALLAADAASIMLVDPHGHLRVVASSSGQFDMTELIQVQADEGPCVDCVRTGHSVTVTAATDPQAGSVCSFSGAALPGRRRWRR